MERKKLYNYLNPRSVTDTKRFSETMKPFFSDKSQNKSDITLIDEDNVFAKISRKPLFRLFLNFQDIFTIPIIRIQCYGYLEIFSTIVSQ